MEHPRHILAAVLYINKPLSEGGRARAKTLIERMTRLAVQHEGTFYLTYARDVEPDDLKAAYPRVEAFFVAKHRIDPENRFTSRFFQLYSHKFLAARAASGR